jgi:hypothetical protein
LALVAVAARSPPAHHRHALEGGGRGRDDRYRHDQLLFVCDQDDPEAPSPLLSATMPVEARFDR